MLGYSEPRSCHARPLDLGVVWIDALNEVVSRLPLRLLTHHFLPHRHLFEIASRRSLLRCPRPPSLAPELVHRWALITF